MQLYPFSLSNLKYSGGFLFLSDLLGGGVLVDSGCSAPRVPVSVASKLSPSVSGWSEGVVLSSNSRLVSFGPSSSLGLSLMVHSLSSLGTSDSSSK